MKQDDIFNMVKNHQIQEIINFIDENPNFDYNIQDNNGVYFLYYVVSINDINLLKKILTTNIKIDIIDDDGYSILFLPIKFGYNQQIKLLLEHNKNTIGIPIQTIMDKDGNIPLHYSVIYNNSESFDLLLPESNFSITDKYGDNILHMAVMTKSLYFVKKITEFIKDINLQNLYGETVIHIATLMNQYEILKYLLSFKFDINIQTFQTLNTILHFACKFGSIEILKLLLDHNVDVNIQNMEGDTPLHVSIFENKINFASVLMTNEKSASRINVNLFNRELMLPLHIVLQNQPINFENYLDLLLEKTNLNFQNNDGETCLHLICKLFLWKKYSHIIKNKKLDILIRDTSNIRPIDYIDEKDYDEFIDLVVESYIHRLLLKKKKWSTEWENKCDIDTKQCYQKTKEKILNLIDKNNVDCYQRTYPIKINTKKCLKLSLDEQINFNTLVGSRMDIIAGLLYLKNKYLNENIILDKFDINNRMMCNLYEKNMIPTLFNDCFFENYFIIWNQKTNQFFFNPDIKNLIIKNKSKYVILYLEILFKNLVNRHANIIIYSKKTNEIERFDPFGSGHDPELDVELEKFLLKMFPKVKYLSPKDYMSKVGFQQIDVNEIQNDFIGDPEGYCVSWSIWYADMRLQYPTIQRTKLIKYIMQQINEKHLKYRSIIRNYSSNITTIRDEILDYAQLNINQYQNNLFTSEQFQLIIDKINQKI
jgi:ankyrin repeat protein